MPSKRNAEGIEEAGVKRGQLLQPQLDELTEIMR